MPAGGRNVNASVCTTRDRSNYLVKSRESSFPTPAQTPVNVDHSRRTWYFFNPAAIELLRRFESLPFSFSPARRENGASILQTFGEYVGTRRRGKPIDHWGTRGFSTFCRVPPLKKNCSRGKVSWNLGSE